MCISPTINYHKLSANQCSALPNAKNQITAHKGASRKFGVVPFLGDSIKNSLVYKLWIQYKLFIG